MLRIYLFQNLYDLSDRATAAEGIDSCVFRNSAALIRSIQCRIGDTLGRFRHILEDNGVQQQLFAQVLATLIEKGLILKKAP